MERVPIESLRFDKRNARKHDEKNLAAIKGSLSAFQQQKPIVVTEDGTVVAGNGTLAAAQALGWTEIDVVRTKLSGDELTAYALADNRSAELASWDNVILGEALHGLRAVEFDLSAIGFDTSYLDNMNRPEPEGARELSSDDFSEFDHKCPRCGFEFDTKE